MSDKRKESGKGNCRNTEYIVIVVMTLMIRRVISGLGTLIVMMWWEK